MERDGGQGLHAFVLPSLIVSPTDVSRVRRELEALDAYMEAQALRETGAPMARMPKTSRLLDDLATLNKLNLLHATVRRDLQQYLLALHDQAPTVHISFAAEPSAAVLQKIVSWLRQNISPVILVRIGLQPSIVAGCTIRTTNRYFDLSLQKHLQARRQMLVDILTRPAPTAAAPEVPHG